MPDIVGQQEHDAVQTVTALGLKPDVAQVPSAQPSGTIVAQHPAGGTKAPRGSGVRLNVSKGKSAQAAPPRPAAAPPTAPPAKPKQPAAAPVSVPSVVGLTLSAAEAKIRAAGLVVDARNVPSSEPKGTVVSQSPSAGTSVKRGSGVLVNVSLGPSKQPTSQATVPDVAGEDQTTARSDLVNAGFTVAVVYQSTNDPTQDGVVSDQTPQGGTRAAAHSKVTIYVAQYNSG